MPALSDVVHFLNNLLSPQEFIDNALNGLQVEAANPTVERVACAVDSGLSVIERAAVLKSDLMIVHHGILWGECLPVTGPLARKLETLFAARCSLYASHLPLDSHIVYGNAAQFAHHLKLQEVLPFCLYKGKTVGVKGKLATPTPLKEVIERCSGLQGAIQPTVMNFGPELIKSIGIVTGSGAFALKQATTEGLDLVISGEAKHEVYHLSKELGLNALFVGHYASETFGVRALGELLREKFSLIVSFIDEGSGI